MKPLFKSKAFAFLFSLAVLAGLIVSCDDNDSPGPNKVTTQVKLATSSTLGSYLVDSAGYTLYFFTRDADGTNNCTSGNCMAAWPIYYKANLTQEMLGEGLLLADFAEITTASGAKQLTYKGWPLYYYSPTANSVKELPGETKGEGVGGVWYVAKTDYTIMLASKQLVGQDGKNYKSDYTEGTGVTQFFTDGKGRTLYTFTTDSKNTTSCTSSGCKAAWPAFTETLASVPSALDKSLFGTIDVDGKKQLTYKGWPLYYFTQDSGRGMTKGVSVPSPGVWPVAIKDAVEAPN
ncbi:hypothetical protein QNI16_09550 [Cytophagaceae bacterium YF14B1]|uniref:Lipoprotein n=1 Tax=Xanthocytophaga flava TaxID=3048013 RepID=A0AAE3QL96_9BACT|nr:hypothetical protein [Xanthocytophaga flavus]MDJ1480726.1 hypothetical protein [Xanthocytophaga flavus]